MAFSDLDVDGITVPGSLIRASTSRAGGPGGQNVNKVETKVTLELDVGSLPFSDEQKERIRTKLAGRINRDGVLRVTSQAERSQLANRDRALARMQELLAGAIEEEKPRKKRRVSRAQKQRRLDEKKRHSEKKKLRRM